MSTFAVVLDANVLIPAAPRDTLLRAAEAGLYRPHWSEMILAEVERNLVEHGMADALSAKRLVDVLREVFPEAAVAGYDDLIARMHTDPKDRHVLAAAVRAHAQVIVTENLRDFPDTALVPYDIEAQSLDEFLTHLFSLAPTRMTRIVAEQAADLEEPPMRVEDVLAALAAWAPGFAELVLNRS